MVVGTQQILMFTNLINKISTYILIYYKQYKPILERNNFNVTITSSGDFIFTQDLYSFTLIMRSKGGRTRADV